MLGGSKAYCSWSYESDTRLIYSKLYSLYTMLTNLPVDLHKHQIFITKSNSRATNHYKCLKDKHVLDKISKDISI